MNTTSLPSTVKQIGGAIVGALVALGVYALYYQSGDAITAYLFPPGVQTADEFPGGEVRLAETEIVSRRERLNARAREIREHMIALRQGTAQTTTTPTPSVPSAQPQWVDPIHHTDPIQNRDVRDLTAIVGERRQARQLTAATVSAPLPLPTPPPVVTAQAMPQDTTTHIPPPVLPSSGTTTTVLVSAAAFVGALFLRRRQLHRTIGYTA